MAWCLAVRVEARAVHACIYSIYGPAESIYSTQLAHLHKGTAGRDADGPRHDAVQQRPNVAWLAQEHRKGEAGQGRGADG
jgi:hypothetical protein